MVVYVHMHACTYRNSGQLLGCVEDFCGNDFNINNNKKCVFS